MFWVILISFCVASAARDYRVTKTDTEYTFDIEKRFARAYYDEQKHQLNIKAIGFDRTWNLPSDVEVTTEKNKHRKKNQMEVRGISS